MKSRSQKPLSDRSSLGIKQAVSTDKDVAVAAAELFSQLEQPGIQVVIFFCSPQYDLPKLAAELQQKFGSTQLFGCTTAGEITPEGIKQGSITATSIASDQLSMQVKVIEDLQGLDPNKVQTIAQSLKAGLKFNNRFNPSIFGLMLIDGLSMLEEKTVALLHGALDGIHLVGGSAGDDLKFHKTGIYTQGQFISNAASLLLVESKLPFQTFKTQHFEPSNTKFVITESEPDKRIVYEINGLPAAAEYARLVGVAVKDLCPEVFSSSPVMVKMGMEWYVRSIQQANPDQSLTFYCAIDNGLVLTIGKAQDMVASLKKNLNSISAEVHSPQLIIACDCILRNLEAKSQKILPELESLFQERHAMGFYTYGEQYNGIHVNQTLTGVILGC